MKTNTAKTAPKPKRPRIKPAMPATTLSPLPGNRRRIKPIKARVVAALALDPTLYGKALGRAANVADNNFSAYIRGLIKKDLGLAA